MSIKLNENQSLQNSQSEMISTLKSEDKQDASKEYERMLQQMEGESREHISVLSMRYYFHR